MNITRNAKILSFFLSLIMVLSVFSCIALPSMAAETEETDDTENEEVITDGENADGETEGDSETEPAVKEYLTVEEALNTYLTKVYTSREEKLATMQLKLTKGDIELYCDSKSGEIGVKNTKTGQILLSNPYDVANSGSDNVKAELLSQISLTFTDLTNMGLSRTLISYTDAAQRGQIDVNNIKNGIRVEYTLGKEAAKKLMPLWMEASRFETMILPNVIDDKVVYPQFLSYYTRIDIENEKISEVITQNKSEYPVVGKTYAQLGFEPAPETVVTDIVGKETTYTYTSDRHVAIWVVSDTAVASERESNLIESWTKSFCPEYNYAEQDFDINLTSYVGEEGTTAIFKLALEYYLTDTGFQVRLPANGIRYDEEAYQLSYISILQYMGASSGDFTGYTFIPDGSGTIIRNEDIAAVGRTYNISGQVYGPDYSYHNLTYNGKSEIMRMPVFGTIENTVFYTNEIDHIEKIYKTDINGNFVFDSDGRKIPVYVPFDAVATSVTKVTDPETGKAVYWLTDTLELVEIKDEESGTEEGTETPDDGEAVVQAAEEDTTEGEEGDTEEPTVQYEYQVVPGVSVKADLYFETVGGVDYLYQVDENGNPKQQEEVIYKSSTVPQGFFAIIDAGESLANITSAHGGNVTHKYNTTYATLYPLSTDSYNLRDSIQVGEDAAWSVTSDRKYTGTFQINVILVSDYEGSQYKGTYEGMASAYQDYLIANQGLAKISNAAADIPLYIESFGMISTQGSFMTIPVWVDTPLTTTTDIQSMYGKLAEKGVTNVNFRLTGFTEGGMDYHLAATKVCFEKVVGGEDGYNKLVEDAQSKGYGVFPEIDFAYLDGTSLFDNFDYSDWTVRTIDDRYAVKREYDAIYQRFVYVGTIAVSPWAYEKMFDIFVDEMSQYKVDGISFGALGSDLNSDFDEDDPYNRDDNKKYTVELLKKLSSKYSNIMVDGGNAYTYGYVDHILNMALDGSRYLRASQSVPFVGMVLHSYVNIAGTPTNMEGDIAYELLKIIENGASPYFILSAQNTNELKDWVNVADYYSVNFNIWFDDLVEIYNQLNEALCDVQTASIIAHQFVFGGRVMNEEEQAEYDAAKVVAEAAYKAQRNLDIVSELRNEISKGAIDADDDYIPALDENGEVIYPAGLDVEAFVAKFDETYISFEDYFDSGLKLEVDDYSIVYETYENGISFILNYNNFAVDVDINGTTYRVDALGYVKLDASGAQLLPKA